MDELNFALIGGGFMGKAHSLALAAYPIYFWPTTHMPIRDMIVEIDSELAEAAKSQFGFRRAATDWRAAIDDPEIDVVDILLPNAMHREVAIAALEAGKHVICEKPIASTIEDAKAMVLAAEASDRVNQVAYNWRLTPAIQHAARLIDEGAIGDVRSLHGFWLGEFFNDPAVPLVWRFSKEHAGHGALGDLGSHVIDFARLLVGEITRVNAVQRTYVLDRDLVDGPGRGRVDVDDASAFMVEFANGAYGYLEASWSSPGRKSHAGFEIQGSDGAISFNWERMNELQFYSGQDAGDRQGFRTILLGPEHEFASKFWPIAGYGFGYAETKVLQIWDFIRAVSGEIPRPQTTFQDGLEAAMVERAVAESAERGEWVQVQA